MALNAKQQAIMGFAVFQFGARELVSLFPTSEEEAERQAPNDVIDKLFGAITGLAFSATVKSLQKDFRPENEVPKIPDNFGPEEAIWQFVGQVAEAVLMKFRRGWNDNLFDETVTDFLKVTPGGVCQAVVLLISPEGEE